MLQVGNETQRGDWVRYKVVSEHVVNVGNNKRYKLVTGPSWESGYVTFWYHSYWFNTRIVWAIGQQ